MIECSNCGLMINKNDKKCPRCGHVFDVHKKEKDILTGVGATAAGVGVIAAGVVSHEKETKDTIKSIKNNALKKNTEKIENTESVKRTDSKNTTETSNQNKKQTSFTAYESEKHNDSLEISENNNSTAEDSDKELEEPKSDDIKTQATTTASSKKTNDNSSTQSESVTQEELVNLLEKLEEEQGNEENIKTILKEFSENHQGDKNLEELLKALMSSQENTDDIDEIDLEEEDELKSTADSSDMGGDGINISFYSLEQALALLGEPSFASGAIQGITSCPNYDNIGGIEKVFERLESGNFSRIKNVTSSFDNYRETIKGFFGENGSGGFVDNLRSSLVGLREKLKAMYTEEEYLEAYNREMNYRFYDEYGHLDVEKAIELYNSLHIDDRKSRWDLSTMSDEEYTAFYASFSSDERVQNYFDNFEKNILNGVESIESKDYTLTDYYLRNKENGVTLTEEEVKNHYEDFGDRIALGLYTGILGLGLIDLNSGYDGNKTYQDFIDNHVNDGLTGYDTDAQGNKTGEEKADYNGKSDFQKQLEILTYSWYAKDNSHYDSEQYKILSAYVDQYCEEKNIDKIDLPTNDHLYQLLQAGASNALWNEDGSFKTRTYFDEETGEMSEQEKIIKRYERAITGGYNENGELDNHRDSEWRINRTTFEESFILSNNYVRKSDALTEATKNHSELFEVNKDTGEIIYTKESSEYDEEENDLYEIAKKASKEYKEALDAMSLFGFFVNQSQIDEAKKEAGENYSKDDYPAGVKEYLEYMNSDNKNPYQYMAKYDADNYSDAVEKFEDSMGSKVPHVIKIFSEMPSVKEGKITAEELAKNLSNSLSTNADYYHMYLESVESQHITNATRILSLAQTRSENYKWTYYNIDQQNISYYEVYGTPEEEEAEAKAIEKANKDYEKWQSEEQLGKKLAQEIGNSQARLSTMSRDIETVQYNKIMAKLPTERTEEEKDFCMRYRIERTGTEQKEFIAQLNDYYEKLSNCKNINEAVQLLNYISMINENKLCNLEQVFEGKKLRLSEDFEEASKSIIASIKIENIVEGETVITVIHKYDKDGNEINASQEETDLYYAKLAKENGGKLPFIYSSLLSSKDLERINYLMSSDIDLLTYKLHTEDSEAFKDDYKNYIQYGALIQARAEYQQYLDKLERRGDFGDWITTVGYGARAGFEQFADGVSSFMNPDGIKSSSEYRSMLISTYLLDTYGSDALNSNFMLGTYEVTTSMANMLPSVALSMIPVVGQYLSLASMFISSAGNSMEQAYQNGFTLEQSYVIGLISGALETGLQATVGGISKLKIKGKNPLGFLKIGDKLLSKMTEGTLRYALTNYGFNILYEALEEGTQEFLSPFVKNIVKYGFDYKDNFQEWQDTLSEMSLEEWQETKFIEWKSDNLSNNTSTANFFSIKNMTLEEWLNGIEKGEIRDVTGNILKPSMIGLSEFNRLKSSDYTAKEWYESNKSRTDIQSIVKAALYGAISGGIFEGVTSFAPEVISYTRTGTTLGINAIMNAVRNQSAASGTPKNIFQIMAETNQIIKEQSKTGKMSELVEQYINNPSFQSEYESYINDIEQSINETESTSETESNNKLLKSLKSIKESLFGPKENISEVQFATMKVANDLARTSLKNRIIASLDATAYQSYPELLDAREEITRTEEAIKAELERFKAELERLNETDSIESSELSESLLSELIKDKENSLKALAEKKAGLDRMIKIKEALTENLKLELSEELINIIESINSNETTVTELEQLLSETMNSNNSDSNSKAIEELENRIYGKTKELNNKKAKNEITEKQIEIKTKEIEQLQERLKSLKENTKKSKEQKIQKINETINKLKENIESNKARMNEIESIIEIITNPKFKLSNLTVEQFNNFISNLDLNSLQVYAKDIVSRLSDLSDTRISELIEKLDPITLGVFENQIVERVKHITEEEVLNSIKDKNASKFTQNIYKIEVSSDTTTDTAETIVTETRTETISENTDETESNTRDNNSSVRETINSENETSTPEAKKELVSQNAALGTIGLIQMGALTGGLKGNQTLNNVLETIQTDINSLKQKYESTTINGEVNAETEVNVNGETNSNINVREELKSQIEQKTKLYNDLTQLMSKYGVDGTELLTTLKEEIVSEKYKLEHQLLNTETNIEETIIDSIRESEAAIKEIMQQFDLTKVDQTTLNEARTAAMYKILEIANKNNISVDSILSKINIDEMLVKNDIQIEFDHTIEGVKTIKSLDQIIDEDIRSKLVETIEKNQESNKKFREGKISDAIAELSWSEINKILESSNNTSVIDELCQIWSTKQIGPIMSNFNYEQTVKIVNELKNGISIETLNDLNIERINNGMTIEEIYIERAHNIINSINPKYSKVSISNEFARAIVRNSQQLIKYKANSSYQNRYVENLLKFSPDQLNKINNLFNTISEYKFTQAEISDTQIAELGKIILDSIYDINSLGEQNIKLNMWAINGILKEAPNLTNKNISEYNGMITSLISNYFFHNGEYIFIRNQEQLNLYGKDILYGLYGHEVNINDIIKIDGSKIIIDSEFKNIIKNKLNNYETRILYNYLEASIKESLIKNQKDLNNKLYKLNNEIVAQQTVNNEIVAQLTAELNQVIESIRNNARLASSFRTELRFILQNAGFGISVLPKQGTNLLNATYEGAVISKTLKSKTGFLEVQNLLSDFIAKTSLEIDKNAFQNELANADDKGIRTILNKLAKFDSNLISDLYKKLIVIRGNNFIINYEQGVFEGAFKSNEFVNLTLGITNVEESIFNEKIKSWEEKIEGNHDLKDYDLLDKYTYWKYVKEVYNKDSEKVITDINWPELGGYLGIPKKLLDFIESNFEGQETLYISRLGGKNGTNVSLTSKSSTETLFGKLKDGSHARAVPYLFCENLMEGKINIAKYITLCDCLYEYLFEQSTNKTIKDTSALIKKLKDNNINVDETKVKELIKAYERTYNKSATLKDFRIINKNFIKRFIENGQSIEEFNNLIKETSLENQNKIKSMMEKYISTKDERILDDIISILGPEFRINFDLRYGIGGTIASFVDLPGGGTQATLMFAYGLLEECGIIEGTQSGIVTSEGSYLLPIELTENVDENSIKKLKKSIYELMKLKNSSNNLEIDVKYLEIDIAIDNIIKDLKTKGKYTQNIEETIKAFKKTMDFNKFIHETSKMTNIIEYIGNLSIPEIDALIKNEAYIFDLGETGNFVKIAMKIYNRGLEAASTKYSEFYQNFRDHGFKHALEVTKYAIELAQKLNLTEAEIELVAYSSLAHDFGMQGGKVYIDDELLNKFTKYYIEYLKEIPNAELMNSYKEMFKNKLITKSKNGRVWDIDVLKEYLKNEFGNFISNKKYITDVARSSHPLNSALDILANSNMIPSTLQESIAKIFGEENSKNVATSLIALLAMSHSKSTSGIKFMDQSQMWLNCIEKLELSAKARGVDENLNVEALNRIIENPELFEKLQDMAILVRDGDAMSKVVSEDGSTKTVMQNGENAILDLSNVRGEKLFNEDGKLITESEEQSRIIETTTSGRVIDNNISKGIHAGELNTEYDSKYSKENGNKKYNATVRVKDSSLAPHSTLSNSILERLGELNTYTNMDERTFTIYLSAETDQRIIDLYNKVIEDWKTNAKNKTESSLSSIGIQPGTPQYNEIIAKQQAFYDNIQIKYE